MKKQILLMSLMTVFLFTLMGAANAALSFNETTAEINGTHKTRTFGVGSTTMDMIVNCSWTAYSTAKVTNKSSTDIWKNTVNTTGQYANHTTLTVGGTPSDLMDATYTMTATCSNLTGALSETATMTTLIVDTSSPVCETETYTTSFSDGDIVDPDATWSMISGNATSAILYFDGGNPRAINTYSLTNRYTTWAYSDHIPKTIYDNVYFTVSDGQQTTTCTALKYIDVDKTSGAKKGIIIADLMTEGGVLDRKKLDPMLLIATVVVLYFWTRKKK